MRTAAEHEAGQPASRRPLAGHDVDWLQAALYVAPVAFLVVMAWTHRWVADDAFIDLRTIQQLEAGHGPVFNAGERVESFTSAAWVALLALGRLLTLHAVDLSWMAIILAIPLSALAVAAALAGSVRWQRACGRRARAWPAGVLVVVALPPMWDFATSGLETALVFAWLGCVFWALSARFAAAAGAGDAGAARPASRPILLSVAIGLGVLIRPDLAMYSVAFLVALWVLSIPGWRGRLASLAWAAALPAAYLVFRMGYYGVVVPNTAIAKNATDADLAAGLRYLRDLIGPYVLVLPLALLGLAASVLPLGEGRGADARRTRRQLRTLLGAPVAAAIVQTLYVTRVGGDFMHARFLLPALFALVLPVGAIVIEGAPARVRYARVGLAGLTVWAVLCAFALRTPYERNESAEGVVNERLFWSYITANDHPVSVDDWAAAPLVQQGRSMRRLAEEGRDVLVLPDGRQLPARPGTGTAVLAGNIGALSVAAGPDVRVIDDHGLADVLAARTERVPGAYVGHEKILPEAWIVARFTPESPDESAEVRTARRVLACADVADLLAAVDEPLSGDRIVRNITGAVARSRLSLPRDPAAAEQARC